MTRNEKLTGFLNKSFINRRLGMLFIRLDRILQFVNKTL